MIDLELELEALDIHRMFNGCLTTHEIADKAGIKYWEMIGILRRNKVHPIKVAPMSYKYTQQYLRKLKELYFTLKARLDDYELLQNMRQEIKYLETLKLQRK
jgi:hypothetical protein